MHTQKRLLQEVTIRMPPSAIQTWGFEAVVSIWNAHEDEPRFRSLSARGSRATLLVETSHPLDTGAFAAVEYITELRLVGHGPDRFEYLLEMDAPRCQRSLDESDGEFFVKEGPILSEAGLDITIVVTQEMLRRLSEVDVLEACEVLRVAEYTGHRKPLDALTERQRTVLETAYAKGYYAVPRRVSSDELADDLGVEPATVLEHLRRAEHNVLSELLDIEDHRASFSQRGSHDTTVERDRTESVPKETQRNTTSRE